MLPGSAMAGLSPAMRRRGSALSGARNWLPDMLWERHSGRIFQWTTLRPI
jgi:hypothetical protein